MFGFCVYLGIAEVADKVGGWMDGGGSVGAALTTTGGGVQCTTLVG